MHFKVTAIQIEKMIANLFQKYPESFALQLFIMLQ